MTNHDKPPIVVAIPDHDHHNHKKPSYTTHDHIRRKIATTIVVILVIVAITALVLWLLYHTHNPKFTVVSAVIYGVNTTSPPVITAMQFTIITRNPNTRVAIHYDHLTAFLSYQYQPISLPLVLPPLRHEGDTTVAMSPTWQVAPAVVNGLVSDDGGVVSLRVVLTGKLRWKGGSVWKSRRKGVHVGCDVLVGLKRGVLGQVPLARSSECVVDI